MTGIDEQGRKNVRYAGRQSRHARYARAEEDGDGIGSIVIRDQRQARRSRETKRDSLNDCDPSLRITRGNARPISRHFRTETRIERQRSKMQKRAILTTVALGIFVLGTGSVASATDYRSFQTGDWNVAGNWEYWDGNSWQTATVKPGANDYAVIRNGHDISVAGDEFIDRFDVNSGGELIIEGTRSLTVDGSVNSTSDIDGTVTLQYLDGASTLAFEDNNHTLTGVGLITSSDRRNLVTIEADIVVDAQESVSFEGAMKIQGPTGGTTNGTLDLTGDSVVKANSNGAILELHQDLILDADNDVDSPFASFEASLVARDSGILLIDCTAASTFDGNLLANNGTLDIDSNFQTYSSGSSKLAVVSGGSCDIDGTVCVEGWIMGCTSTPSMDSSGGNLLYDTYTVNGGCTCADPGSSATNKCRNREFSGSHSCS